MTKESFFQEGPQLGNQYRSDIFLINHLKRTLPKQIFQEVESDLNRFGQLVATDFNQLACIAESQPPELISFDPWGRRIDEIKVSQAWQELHHIAAREGLIALGYERHHGIYSRVYQMAKLYLFAPSSAMVVCPLAMTDGAARLIEKYGDEKLKASAFQHLITRNPDNFWTSGQWMTEKIGGSDVANTETIAKPLKDGTYALYGSKWFTSATTSQIAMTLARVQNLSGEMVAGSRGLGLFYLETRTVDGRLNGIRIDRLKDKLGTRALPTAELTLEGCQSIQIGPPGEGVKIMSSLFNITRIYNAMIAVSYMRRSLALARDYASRRTAFGKKLIDLPLHGETLANLEVEFRGAFLLGFSLASLLGKVECEEATETEKGLLRLMTPVAKLYTAKQANDVVREVVEAMGGAGYIENTGMPRWIRDTQVLSIWEGTTNVLSLDMLRSFKREQTFGIFVESIERKLANTNELHLRPYRIKIEEALKALIKAVESLGDLGGEMAEAGARALAYSVARIFVGTELLSYACWAISNHADSAAIFTLKRWTQKDMVPCPWLHASFDFNEINELVRITDMPQAD